jgi:hypothetical protein
MRKIKNFVPICLSNNTKCISEQITTHIFIIIIIIIIIIIVVVVVVVIIITNCKWVCTRWQWYYNTIKYNKILYYTIHKEHKIPHTHSKQYITQKLQTQNYEHKVST